MEIKEYCPYCLCALDKVRSCWSGGPGACEYEADNCKPGYEPLTYKGMLEEKSKRYIVRIHNAKKATKELRKLLAEINIELEKIKNES